MSELINNSNARKSKLKELILKLHSGESQEKVRAELIEALTDIPYGEVVEVEQELIAEGLPQEEVLKLCDVHSAVLQGNVDLSQAKKIPEGHPVDILIRENKELSIVASEIKSIIEDIRTNKKIDLGKKILQLRGHYNSLYDVDKHYLKKEYLVFPYLENQGITGPPKVMWGKHDEIRELLKGSMEVLQTKDMEYEEFIAVIEILLLPAVQGVLDMIPKEEEILFPMALDKIPENGWYEISKQSLEFGYCLYDPQVLWKPEWATDEKSSELQASGDNIQLPTGSFTLNELNTIMNTLPIDITFVDRNDKVKYFSHGMERIFQRSRAILNRDVRHCHPPASAHIVDKIIEDFRSGRQSRAPFWINLGDKMVYIEYFAVRDEDGNYLGTIEVSQNIKPFRELEGEQRILSYK